MPRTIISSGTPWEAAGAYARAVRVGDVVYVSGTTASDATGTPQHPGDPAGQAEYILRKIDSALQQAGSSLREVVRVRTYVTDITQWRAVSAVHARHFQGILPTSTLVEVSRLVDPQHLVEIEVEAVIGSAP
ncbi:MAG: RidA family protein [Dehalococcoidia bacterium]|nr:RidA family protein [Dehalococcoidia bacterium]